MTQTAETPNDIRQVHRGDGTTTKQIKASPIHARYVTPNIDYTSHLALSLGRGDLKMEPMSFFENHRWRGLRKSQVVVDHAVPECMEREQRVQMYEILRQMHD